MSLVQSTCQFALKSMKGGQSFQTSNHTLIKTFKIRQRAAPEMFDFSPNLVAKIVKTRISYL